VKNYLLNKKDISFFFNASQKNPLCVLRRRMINTFKALKAADVKALVDKISKTTKLLKNTSSFISLFSREINSKIFNRFLC